LLRIELILKFKAEVLEVVEHFNLFLRLAKLKQLAHRLIILDIKLKEEGLLPLRKQCPLEEVDRFIHIELKLDSVAFLGGECKLCYGSATLLPLGYKSFKLEIGERFNIQIRKQC